MARREERAYREYVSDEQRSQPGCPARELCDESLLRDTSPKFLGLRDSIPLIRLKKRQYSPSVYWQQSKQLVRPSLDGRRCRNLFERQLRIVRLQPVRVPRATRQLRDQTLKAVHREPIRRRVRR